jgi:transcriptional regulator with XRE-family HTH domain
VSTPPSGATDPFPDFQYAKDLGGQLRRFRKLAGLTLEQVQVETGISLGELSSLENGKQPNPGLVLLLKLQRVYRVPSLEMFLGVPSWEIARPPVGQPSLEG